VGEPSDAGTGFQLVELELELELLNISYAFGPATDDGSSPALS
jgi:hypothetical protein